MKVRGRFFVAIPFDTCNMTFESDKKRSLSPAEIADELTRIISVIRGDANAFIGGTMSPDTVTLYAPGSK